MVGLLLATVAGAQVVGAILTGSVADPSGAVAANATVTIRNVGTGIETVTQTNAAGIYSAANLLPGEYTISAAASGLASGELPGLTLTVGEKQILNIQMRMPKIAETVDVKAGAGGVELGSAAVSHVVDGRVARELPLNGRDWTQLALLQPGVSLIRTQPDANGVNNRGNRGFGSQVTIASARPQQNNYRLDGVSVNDYANSSPGTTDGLTLGAEAIAQFSVISSNYSASYGLTSGGVISAMTRAGANDFHGSAYEFFRDDALDARGFFDDAKQPFRRNQFGLAAGGPIVRSRTFFFANYEGRRQSLTATGTATVPTGSARSGHLVSGDTTVDPEAQRYLGLFALPSGPIVGDTGLYKFPNQADVPEDFFTVRMDHTISARDNLHGTYLFDNGSTTQPDSLNVVLNLNQTKRHVAAIEETHVFGSRFANTVRAGVNRVVAATLQTAPGANPLGSDPSLGIAPGLYAPVIQVTGLTNFGGGLNGTSFGNYWFTTWQAYDDAFWNIGKHSIKAGFAFERIDSDFLLAANPNGVFRFNTLADFLGNRPASLQFHANPIVDRMMSSLLAKKENLVALSLAIASALLTVCQSAFAATPTLDISQYAHTAWTVADGFTKGAIYKIAQTPDGYLWLGTEFGLLRFDGVRTTPWPSDRVLPSSKISSLITGRDGTLWIGTSKGMASWKDGTLTTYAELAGHIADRLLEDRNGTIWVRALKPPTGKLCAVRNSGTRCWGEDGRFGARITTIYEDRKGQLWFGEPHGVWQWSESQPRFYPLPGDKFVQTLNEDADGVLLVLLSGTIHRMVDGKQSEVYRLPGASGQLTTPVEMLRDRDGGLWFGALGGGLVHLHEGTIDQFSQSEGLSSDSVAGLFQDREGSIWVATHGGLDRFREFPVTPFTLQQGFSSLRVLAAVASTDGSTWLRTVDGVNHWNDGHVTVYRESPDLSNGTAMPMRRPANDDVSYTLALSGGSLFQDERGRVWVSTVRSVGYFDHGRFHVVPGVPGGRVHAITGDFKGNVWLAYETQGLLHLAGERVIDQIPWARLGHADYADALAVDPSTGGLWLGFYDGGIEFMKDGQAPEARASYAAAEGLAQGRVNDLRVGRDGALWAAAEGGINRLKNGHIATLSSRDGLPCDEGHWTIEDDAGDFWVSMPCGLVRMARADLDAWARLIDGKRHPPSTIRLNVFGTSDGVRSRANAGPFSPHVAKATDGRLWFFPLEGLSVADPRRMSLNTLPPPVNVEQITADRTSYDPSAVNGRVRLPPLVRDLQIDFTALSLVAPDKLRFRYRLEGLDKDWQDVGNRRQAFYTNLRPGPYRFRVTASNNSGVWNEAGASLDFSVAPAYYQTTWFLALSIATVIAVVWAGHRLRLRIVEKHEEEISALNERLMKAQEQERIRIAGELHDGVMQEMLSVTLMLGAAKRRIAAGVDASATIDKVQQKVLEVGTGIRQLSHELHPPVLQDAGLPEAVRAYCDQFSTTCGTPVVCDADEGARDLSSGAALAVFRIVQEALGNAAKHAAATRITVRLTRSNGRVSLVVADDGIGFDSSRLSTSCGLGLIMMRERASQLHGTFEFESGPRRGTTIRVVIPFR